MGEGIGSTDITDLGHEVFQIDTRMAGYDGITAGYLIRADRPCLVETGTAPSAPVVRDALARLGIGADDLATVVVTHIHLDHAGGAGDIAAMFPAAQIVVHQRGARHLADPSRLMASARMVYGRRARPAFRRARSRSRRPHRGARRYRNRRPRRRPAPGQPLLPRSRQAPRRPRRLRYRRPVRRRRGRRVPPRNGGRQARDAAP